MDDLSSKLSSQALASAEISSIKEPQSEPDPSQQSDLEEQSKSIVPQTSIDAAADDEEVF